MTESLRRSMFGSNDQYAQTPENVLQQLKDLFNDGNEMWDPCQLNRNMMHYKSSGRQIARTLIPVQ